MMRDNSAEDSFTKQGKGYPYATFFQLLYLFMASNVSYWLASISATQLAGSPFVNVLLVCVGEVTGVLLAGVLHKKKCPDNLTN